MKQDDFFLWSTGHLYNAAQIREENMADILQFKNEYELRNPDRIVRVIGLYKENLLFSAPYRYYNKSEQSTALFLINKQTGEEIGPVLYHTDFEGIERLKNLAVKEISDL